MNMTGRHILQVVGVVLCTAATVGAATVTIDGTRTYQTMEGMGTMNRVSQWGVKQGAFTVPAPLDGFYDSLINVMGFTVMRPAESCRFNPSPGVYDMDELNSTYENILEMQKVAEANDEPFMVAPSVFSPPGYMKLNGKCMGDGASTYPIDMTNSLSSDYYDAFGEFCATYISHVQDTLGIPVYAFSAQNEPYFNEPYSSCSYGSGRHYASMLQVVGPYIREASPSTLIYGAEHMAHMFPSWEGAIRSDVEAGPYLDRYAFHGYTDGVQVDTTSFDSVTVDGGRPVWMTETGGPCDTHEDGLVLARSIMRNFNQGLSAWMFCGCIGNATACGWLVAKDHPDYPNGTPGPAYWAHAHFARFARPGWKRIAAESDNAGVLVSAFASPTTNGLSVVFINTGSSTENVSLSLSGVAVPSAFDGRLTTAGEKFADMGAVSPSSTIALPPESIVSLGVDYRGTVTAVRGSPRRTSSPSRMTPGRGSFFYDVAGRRVPAQRALQTQQGVHGCLVKVEHGRAVTRVVR